MTTTREESRPATGESWDAVASGQPVLHYYWPSEFPVALCGAISTLPTLPGPGELKRGVICGACKAIRDNTPSDRANPHRPASPPEGP